MNFSDFLNWGRKQSESVPVIVSDRFDASARRLIADRLMGSEELSDDELELLLEEGGSTLTDQEGSRYYLSRERDRRTICVLESGVLLVTRQQRGELLCRDFLSRSDAKGFKISHVKIASLEQIGAFYKKNKSVRREQVHTKFQTALYDLIQDAAAARGSDIHIKIKHDKASIAFTIRGNFTQISEIPADDGEQLLRAAFNNSGTGDTNYVPTKFKAKRLDRSPRFQLPEGVQALRLQFSPLDNSGRELTARLIYSDFDRQLMDIDSLGYEEFQVEDLAVMRRQADGLILISGPTGSGKSTTLKMALERTGLERGGTSKIVSIEDPPEFEIRNASQLQVETSDRDDDRLQNWEKAFAALLRMAPNITMVGEIRERVVAKLTFSLAETGHLTFASVHANSALEIIDRLRELHVSAINLSRPNMIQGLIAQRLVSELCPHCSLSLSEADEHLPGFLSAYYASIGSDRTKKMRFVNKVGCEQCVVRDRREKIIMAGYKGRIVIAETIVPTFDLLTAQLEGRHTDVTRYWLETHKGSTMMEHGLFRVLRGEVDPRDLQKAGDVTRRVDPERIDRLWTRFKMDQNHV